MICDRGENTQEIPQSMHHPISDFGVSIVFQPEVAGEFLSEF